MRVQRRILCAEGHPDTREFLVIWLGFAGYEVSTTDTVSKSVRMASRLNFDLYLIGERFPDGSGFDLAERIRFFDQHTPLVFHSTQAYQTDIERGLKAGAQAYITKPSDPKRLVETITQLINNDYRSERSRIRIVMNE